nr:globin [uncultured bacterium]
MSLFDQLGGVYGLAPLVDDFVDRLWENKVVNANPNFQEAKKRYAKASLRFLMTEYLCKATDGPCDYRGRDMKTAHASLGITEKEWQAMLGDLRLSMAKFSVPAELQGDVVALIEAAKKDIVVGAPAKPAAPHEHH